MALLAYNKSGAALALAAGNPIITLPALGGAVDVTAALTGLTGPNYTALEAQRVAGGTKVRYKWTKDVQFATGTLKIEESHEDLEVADLATLTNLDDADVPDASECLVLSLGQYFRLDKTYPGAANGITVIAASVGKWLRLVAPVTKWTDQATWYVNYNTGNDEWDGTAALAGGGLVGPLKTVAEFTRRVKVAKYGSGFAGYTIELATGVDVGLYDAGAAAYRDSFQWDFSVQSMPGLVNNDQDSGITRSLLQINGKKSETGNNSTVVGAGTSITFDNVISKIQRAAGAFAVGDVIEFTDGPGVGKRCYVLGLLTTDTADDTAIVNPWTLAGAVPLNGNAFKTYSLTKWGPQISGYGTQGQHRIQIDNVELPGLTYGEHSDGLPRVYVEGDGCPDYEMGGFVLRFRNCLSRISITGGIGGRVRWGQSNTTPSAIIKGTMPTATSTTVDAGDDGKDYAASGGTINVASTANMPSKGMFTLTNLAGGAQTLYYTGKTGTSFTGVSPFTSTLVGGNTVTFLRQNNFMTIERGDIIANFMSFANVVIDVMNIRGILTMSQSCLYNGCIRMGLKGAGSVSQTQAGPTFVRLDRVSIWDVPTTVRANPFVGGDGDPGAALIMKRGSGAQVRALYGSSVNATTKGIDISEGSALWLQDWATPSTVTGNGALSDIMIDGGDTIPVIVAGLPAAGSVIQTWANLAGFGEVCMNLKNGTRIVKVA